MRILGRLLLGLLILPALLWGGWALYRAGASLFGGTASAHAFANAESRFVYPLDRSRPTTFVFSHPQKLVRILTHADLAAQMRQRQRGWAYSYVVEALDEDGSILDQREVFSRSIILYLNSGERRVPASFYTRGDDVPSAGDQTLVEYEQPVSAIRLRPGRADRGVHRVAASVYERRPSSERQLEVGWERLSAEERRALARSNVLPPGLTSPEERRQFLINRWYPVGPAGVQGVSYDRRTLYERRSEKDQETKGSGRREAAATE